MSISQPLTLFNNTIATLSMGADFKTSSVNITECTGIAIQVIWTGGGTPIGTITVQCSNVDIDSAFVDISGSAISISGNTGSGIFNISSPEYQFIRVKYVCSGGTANASVIFSGKRI